MGLLRGRVAIVTGASSGIGAATARCLAAEGAKVVVAARRAEKLEALAAEIAAAGGEAFVRVTDASQEDDVKGLFADTLAHFGQLDVLVNSAGIADNTKIEDFTLELWRHVLDSNLTSCFLCSREAFKLFKEQGRGRIINVGSTSAKVPRFHSPAYTASKFAMDGLTRSMAIDGREFGITASIVHPGSTITEFSPRMSTAKPGPKSMAAEDIGAVITLMANLPDHTNLYEAVTLPIEMPFLGRG